MMPDKIKLLNLEVDNLTMEEAVKKIDTLIRTSRGNYVVTPNVDHVVRLEEDAEFRQIYKDACLVLTDGMPLIWISRLYGRPIKEKVSGSDLFPQVCRLAAQKGYTVFFLGAAEGVADAAAKHLKDKYAGLSVVGTYSPPYGFEGDRNEIENILGRINRVKPDILILALGSPKQEKFFYRYRDRLSTRIALAIGASLDFEAGKVQRAPLWMRNAGLEWFYRFCKEPKRLFKRYFVDDIKIIKLIVKYRYGHTKI